MLVRLTRFLRCTILPASLAVSTVLSGGPAFAQAITAVVNGDPITSADVDQQMLLLRILHQPASRNDALEGLIADRLKLHEAQKYGMDANESDLNPTLNRIAQQANMSSQALAAALSKAKANSDIIRTHLRSVAAWDNYVRARNKGLNVSEEDITKALAKNPNRGGDDTDFTLQEIVFVVPVKATAAEFEQRVREAQALRGRFEDCASGLPLARSLPNVAIKAAFRRDAKDLSEGARKQLFETPNGHLTTPERVPTGVQMVAVCGKDQDIDKSTIRDNVQADLIKDRLTSVGDKMYKQLRATAVVERH